MEYDLSTIKEDLLKDSHKFWKKEKLEKYFQDNNIKLDKDSLLELYISLIEEDSLGFKLSIGSMIDEVASTDEKFLELIRKILGENEYDLSNGPITFPLVSIGEKNPELGLELSNKMLEKGGTLLNYSSFPLGGAGRINFQETFERIKELFSCEDPKKIACALRSIRVIFTGRELENKNEIFEMIENASGAEDIVVKAEALECAKDFYSKNRDLCKKLIDKLIKEDDRLGHSFAHGTWIKPLQPPEDNIDFLKICAEHKNHQVFVKVCYALTKLTDQFPKEIMEIIRDRIVKDGYHFGHMAYLLEELGKKNFESAMDFLENYITTKDNPRFSFHLKNIVKDLVSKKSKEKLLPYIQKWISDDEKYKKSLDILLEVISTEYDGADHSDQFIDDVFSFLDSLAKSKGVDVAKITASISNKVLKCAAIINSLKNYDDSLNYDTIKENLKCFPNLKNLFEDSWFLQMENTNNKTHPILRILSQPFKTAEKIENAIKDISNASTQEKPWLIFRLGTMISSMMYLEHLEKNIHNFRIRGIPLKHYKDGLKNEDQFQGTLTELNFASPLLSEFILEPEPKVGEKKLDFKLIVDSTTIYIEAISPEMVKHLELLTGVMRGIKNRVKSKIYDEFKEQLLELSSQNFPVIVVVDIGRSEVDYDSVIDYLYGSPKFTMHMDTETHEVVKTTYHRDTDSMHDLEPQMDMISAVICFKSEMDNSKLIYRNFGKVIKNPYARVSLDEKTIQKIETSLFR